MGLKEQDVFFRTQGRERPARDLAGGPGRSPLLSAVSQQLLHVIPNDPLG